VLVHGAVADHTRWRRLLPYREPQVTVHAMDRRGRGASGDASDYHATREFEDVAAVVDEAAGSAVDLYGHSFGGFCAFGAAQLTSNIHRLVLSTSSAMPLVGSNPRGTVRSPWPPVWLSTRTAVCRRGPVSNPAARRP
jgi:pimeloyl-ACP methyl ester carboxylesterase